LQERREAGSKVFTEVKRKIRLVERDLGSLRFVLQMDDDAILQHILEWKSKQRKNKEAESVGVMPRMSDACNFVRRTRAPGFSGMLSVLYVGDRPISGHFGMRSDTDYEGFVTAYAPELAYYSPGAILLYKTAEAAPSNGLRRIHLGNGKVYPWKKRFANGAIRVASGTVSLRLLSNLGLPMERHLRKVITDTSFERPVHAIYSFLKKSMGG
jgi:CelD/BcsL family acetyltransferase involved in cellulose biosynthesis